MNRRSFLKLLPVAPVAAKALKLEAVAPVVYPVEIFRDEMGEVQCIATFANLPPNLNGIRICGEDGEVCLMQITDDGTIHLEPARA